MSLIMMRHSVANPARPAPGYLNVFIIVRMSSFACGCPYVEILIKPVDIGNAVETTRQNRRIACLGLPISLKTLKYVYQYPVE